MYSPIWSDGKGNKYLIQGCFGKTKVDALASAETFKIIAKTLLRFSLTDGMFDLSSKTEYALLLMAGVDVALISGPLMSKVRMEAAANKN